LIPDIARFGRTELKGILFSRRGMKGGLCVGVPVQRSREVELLLKLDRFEEMRFEPCSINGAQLIAEILID